MEKTYIKYSPETIKLLDSLVNSGNLGLKLEKVDIDGVQRVSAKYKSPSYLFQVDFPTEMFDFEGQEINFYDFGEFAKILKTFKNPNIYQTESSIVLDMDKSSVDYSLGDPDVIKRGFTKAREYGVDVVFDMDAESVKKLNSCKNLFGSEYLSFIYNGETLAVRLTSKTRGDNKYEEYFSIAEETDSTVDFKTFALVLPALSVGEWRVEISNDGVTAFILKNNENINLKIYGMQVEED